MNGIEETSYESPRRDPTLQLYGICKGTYDRVFISTDLEPDDVVAIRLLAPELKGVPLFVVVGQGNVNKVELAQRILASYDIDLQSTIIMQGETSDKEFPIDSFLQAFPSTHMRARTPEGDVTESINTFLREAQRPFALLLKPPYELLSVKDSLLNKTVAAIYGSFNINEMVVKRGDDALNMLRKFKKCLHVARDDCVGRDAHMDPTKFMYWDFLKGDEKMEGAMRAWNTMQVKNWTNTLQTYEDELVENKVDDETKDMLDQVKKANLLHTPFADPLVVCVILGDVHGSLAEYWKRGVLEEKDGNIVFRKDDTSSLYCLRAPTVNHKSGILVMCEGYVQKILFHHQHGEKVAPD